MIKTRKLILKTEIFNVLADPANAKIEISTTKQRSMKDTNTCSVYIYKRVSWPSLCTILGACEKATSTNFTKEADLSFVKGLVSMKANGYISLKHLKKLIALEDEYKYSFNISKSLKTLINTL